MKRYALIVAGGSGVRMGCTTPKQFLLLAGKPVLMHTLEKFNDYEIVLVLPKEHIALWQSLCVDYRFVIPHVVTKGGKSRLESVKNGLQLIPDEAIVAIHDGVRPLLSVGMIERGFLLAAEKGNAVPIVDLTDSIRIISRAGSQALNRNDYRLVQTPQIFISMEIKKAYDMITDDTLTDDASVFEAAGQSLHLFYGEPTNIKITHPNDLIFAEAIVNNHLHHA